MVYEYLLSAMNEGKKLLAILLDPDKINDDMIPETMNQINASPADFVFVGGSHVEVRATDKLVQKIKTLTSLPIVLFPGNFEQITAHADAILFLSLISGRNPEYLINQQVKAVPFLRKSSLEIVPTGYILVDGGKETAVQRVSPLVFKSVKENLDIPLIVGGGIRSGKELLEAYKNGADMVVIGTAFEENSNFLTKIMSNEHIY